MSCLEEKYKVKFINLNLIELVVDSDIILEENNIYLYCNDKVVDFNGFEEVRSNETLKIYNLHIQSFLFGGEYYLVINNDKVFVDVLPIMNQKIIDDKFFYDGEDLGFTYNKKETTFKLWSPLASNATVKIFGKKNIEYEMERGDNGVFAITIKGNLDKNRYLFSTTINGVKRYAIDPYGRASSPNGKESVVIDFSKTYKFKAPELPILEQYTDAVIYETSIRDLTSYNYSNVVHKGQYLGMVESNCTSSNGVDVGLAHLLRLGITHVQILPSFDFATVDELNPSASYNWGYDPMQYNVPEGSYCSNVKDPYNRINEFKEMVDTLHLNGIKVNMDVVYNHMYEHKTTAFEMLTPNYYFRKNADGTMSNGSYCGNEVASERKMVSRFIIDSCKYWIKEYNIDGLRFDLMGLTDIETMNTIVDECLNIKKGLMFYGEGWDMPSSFPSNKRATLYNAFKTPKLAFFNDSFRDIVKGSSFGDNDKRGYLTGQEDYLEGFKYALMGCVVSYCFSPKFKDANQSLNYVECHDNETIFDKIDSLYKQDSPRQKQKRAALISQVVILSFGIPFIHMGQEAGLSKFGEDNTYNKGDRYNQYDYSILEDRKWMVKSLKDCIKVRKNYSFLRISDPNIIKDLVKFENIDNGGIIIDYVKKDIIAPFKEFKIIINPSNKTTYYDLKDYYQVIFNEAGILKDEMYSQSLMINPLTLVIVAKK